MYRLSSLTFCKRINISYINNVSTPKKTERFNIFPIIDLNITKNTWKGQVFPQPPHCRLISPTTNKMKYGALIDKKLSVTYIGKLEKALVLSLLFLLLIKTNLLSLFNKCYYYYMDGCKKKNIFMFIISTLCYLYMTEKEIA